MKKRLNSISLVLWMCWVCLFIPVGVAGAAGSDTLSMDFGLIQEGSMLAGAPQYYWW